MSKNKGGRVTRSKVGQTLPFQTVVAFDTETTGLDEPIKITEFCLIAVRREDIKAGARDLPRVINKLSMCLDPVKIIPKDVKKMAGLSNQLLSGMPPFDTDVFQAITAFLRHLPQPVCVVAHNGINFHFEVLRQELTRIGKTLPVDDVLYLDTLDAFQDIVPEAEDHKLETLYSHYFGTTPEGRHTGEGDCKALLAIIQREASKFMRYADKHAS